MSWKRISRGLSIAELDAGFRRRFWAKVPTGVLGQKACWPWMAATNSKNYGFIWSRVHGGPILAHQASYAMTRGQVRPGVEIIHTCDNPACVNPWHLKEATHAENMADKVRKGRQARGKDHGKRVLAGIDAAKKRGLRFGSKTILAGEKHPGAVLTAIQVQDIRDRFAAKSASAIQLGREFGISRKTIYDIVNHRRWKQTTPATEA